MHVLQGVEKKQNPTILRTRDSDGIGQHSASENTSDSKCYQPFRILDPGYSQLTPEHL